ncbi:MAG TPA: hypothetical protein VGM43_14720 [Bryobacteraceae bacterium]|jgi:hypothetical protein
MTNRFALKRLTLAARWRASISFLPLALIVLAPQSQAQVAVGPVTVGGGLRTDFTATNTNGAPVANQFQVGDARLYVNGPVVDGVTFMFNTDYDSATNKIGVLDAVAQFTASPKFHVWAGRFLPPSDRANLYGPFYSHEWSVYTDGVQDGYPFVFQGRDNGIAYWGDFSKVKISVGGFDGTSATGRREIIGAARVQVDFWDKEEGYYLNGTYYGDKNILALGGASQLQDGHTASTVDFLLDRKLPNGGAFSIESEYSNYNRLGGYNAAYGKSQGAYGLGSYLFPKVVQIGKFHGKFEVLGKYATAEFTHALTPSYRQKTTEFNFNYVIKQFNARVMTFYKDTRFSGAGTPPDFWQAGVGLQIQM